MAFVFDNILFIINALVYHIRWKKEKNKSSSSNNRLCPKPASKVLYKKI